MEIKKKEQTYRGKTLEELRTLDVREFARLTTAKQRRYLLRNFRDIEKFVEVCRKKVAKNKQIRTHLRDLVVVPSMVGMKIGIHNGNTFVPVDVHIEMLGHKFGEFAITRPKIKHNKAGIGSTKGSKHQAKK